MGPRCYVILCKATEYSRCNPGQSVKVCLCRVSELRHLALTRTSNRALSNDRDSAFTPNRGLATLCSVRAVSLGPCHNLLAHLAAQCKSGLDIELRVNECIECR